MSGATTTTTTLNREAERFPAAGFGATLASEWTKLVSVRSTWITLGLGVVLSLAMTALISAVIASTIDSWDAQQQADFGPGMTSIIGSTFGVICFAVLGVNYVASEYSSGMIRLTLATTPRRGRVLAAKFVVMTLVMLVAGLIIVPAMFFLGQFIFGLYDGPTASIGDDGMPRMLIALILTMPVFPVFGSMLAFVIRGTGGTITAILGIIFGPGLFGGLLPAWWQENIISRLPGYAADGLAFSHIQDSNLYADLPIALGALIFWIVVFVGAAWLSLTRRDA